MVNNKKKQNRGMCLLPERAEADWHQQTTTAILIFILKDAG